MSLIGTFAGMYVLGYSIDNLSLLALTLSVGFVVDDAIVMLENIVRHIENGMRPMEAALKGSREIGFTILSMTLSLVAVFIPVLFMGGVVGRLFREFAVTISMAILISGIVSLTLTPMLCVAPAEGGQHGEHAQCRSIARPRRLRRGARAPIAGRCAACCAGAGDHAGRHARCRSSPRGYLFVVVPKGFFPIEDTGLHLRHHRGGAGHLVRGDGRRAASASPRSSSADPERRRRQVDVGAVGFSPALNTGPLFIELKPRERAQASAPTR